MRSLHLSESGRAQCGQSPLRSLALLGERILVLLMLLILPALWPAARAQGQAANAVSSSPSPDGIPDQILYRVDDTNLTTIHGSTHPALRNAIDNGRLPATTPMGDLVLVLNRSESQQAALDSFNEAQNDPSSPEYHHWLTPQEFGAAYGVSSADLDAVSNWLQSHGFSIQEISPARTSIRFSGNSEQVETTFHTEMHAIQSKGVAHIANTSDIQIPAALTPVVAGVKALHNFFPKAQHHTGPMLSRNSSGTWTPVSGTSSLPALSQPGSQEIGAANLSGLASAKPEYTAEGYQLLVPYDLQLQIPVDRLDAHQRRGTNYCHRRHQQHRAQRCGHLPRGYWIARQCAQGHHHQLRPRHHRPARRPL